MISSWYEIYVAAFKESHKQKNRCGDDQWPKTSAWPRSAAKDCCFETALTSLPSLRLSEYQSCEWARLATNQTPNRQNAPALFCNQQPGLSSFLPSLCVCLCVCVCMWWRETETETESSTECVCPVISLQSAIVGRLNTAESSHLSCTPGPLFVCQPTFWFLAELPPPSRNYPHYSSAPTTGNPLLQHEDTN